MSKGTEKHFQIAGRTVGIGHKPFVIAEVAQAHDGSTGAAHAFIDLAAECGADAIKFQTHIAAAESTRDEPFRVNFSYEDQSRFDYWKRMEFKPEIWAELAEHAQQKKLIFLSSPFSLEAVELLQALDVPAWKVASGEVHNWPLLDAICRTGKPILLSSGMSSFEDLARSVNHVKDRCAKPELAIFQCTTEYPTPLESVGLNVLSELADMFDVPVGLSDHSADTLSSIAAMTLGASLIEVHIAFHQRMFGPDTASSLVPSQLSELCRARDAIHVLLNHCVDKDKIANSLKSSAKCFGRSLALKVSKPAGTVLTAEMVTLKKPGFGLPSTDLVHYVGRRLSKDVESDRLLKPSDFVV